jgi:hypothetical protein
MRQQRHAERSPGQEAQDRAANQPQPATGAGAGKAHIAELEAVSHTASAEERKPMFDANDLLKRIEQQQAQIAELEAASGKASVARAGLAGPLEALVERMNDKGFGERDVPDFVESKPTFEPLDLIELAKWIRFLP